MIKGKTKSSPINLIDHTLDSICKAQLLNSKLNSKILNFEKKWTVPKVRHF